MVALCYCNCYEYANHWCPLNVNQGSSGSLTVVVDPLSSLCNVVHALHWLGSCLLNRSHPGL